MQTLRRELRLKFDEVISNFHIGDDGPPLSERLADAALEVRGIAKAALPAKSDIGFLMASGASNEEIAAQQEVYDHENAVAFLYETEMGYNPLPWHSDKDLTRLLRFLLTQTPESIRDFAAWSKRKFSTFDPAKARQFPLRVIEFWPMSTQSDTEMVELL